MTLKNSRLRPARLGIGTALWFAASCALSWGADGHRLVADAAEQQLTVAARAEVGKLLALEPGATLSSVANWADETRSLGTASWHYVNFARGGDCRYDASRQCLAGRCVVGAIEKQLDVLASSAPGEERLAALKYVVHLVADVHQPLHAGFADDRGGNDWQLQAFGRGSNLHALWDSGLIRNWPGGLSDLRRRVLAEPGPTAVAQEALVWAEQSCRIVASEGFQPATHVLAEGYDERWNPVLVQQLRQAAQQLAAVLNERLGGQAR
ncbi:MAG: S1/P1 nuclease [Rubrivivax sp.]|nr:S1/P1 nuclease [Rubrivivax sp.]